MPQSLAQVYLHIVYSTKNREPFLRNPALRQELHAYMATVVKEYGSIPFLIGGTADHVHMLITLPRTETYAKIIGETKRNSSKWMKTKGAEYANFYWQNGYGAFSVSHSMKANAEKYIQNQEEHHRKRTFQEEYRALLQKHGIKFDERYVWD